MTPDERWERISRIAGNSKAVRAAKAVIADRDAEIASLRAQLDAYQGRAVYYTTDAGLWDAAKSVVAQGRPETGTIIRATDTGRELGWDDEAGWTRREVP